MDQTDREKGVLVGIKIASGLAAALFGATAFLAVWDASGKFRPLHGFLQNIGLALVALSLGYLAGYLLMKR